ncbi:hypothetical protein [Flavobacterium gilvum]|uniref:Uncharacterized protein n=1 Tax=Flavobacterium gilvum TaxID=1492737 RepID=A0AAC9N788_9FLAO|nr:hypothetical protein [Flavobacterium gilvum]AOW10033.1 hypothetical protein EM308_11215 [Flavobacterium gilvum]KFC60438.1 hypothetical protein FEM08_08150 [Flavobacterium gilvum]
MFKSFREKQAQIIENTDPDRIYIENIRSFFNIPTRWAKFLCKLAVRQGIFRKKFAVECKNENCNRIIKVYDNEEEIPTDLSCLTCELEGQTDFSFKTKDLNIVEYYQYIENGNTKTS